MLTFADQNSPATSAGFENRRQNGGVERPGGMPERRQFRDARENANPDAEELAAAVQLIAAEDLVQFCRMLLSTNEFVTID